MISAEAFLRAHPVAVAGEEPSVRKRRRPDATRFHEDEGRPIEPAGEADARPGTAGPGIARFGAAGSADDSGNGGTPARRGRATVPPEDADDVDACREAALRLLDAAPRSRGALRDRLAGKGYADGTVEQVLDRLAELRLLDDREYAESVVRACMGRMMGRRGVLAELARKGVDRPVAAAVAQEAEERGLFEEAAWELGRRTARRTAGLDRDVRRRRFWSAGGRKGHDPETLRRVAAELLD
ncbi:regulatory protein RecX [Bifidobacterium saguinibicoloris]|uniref:regulatory protein RecX n=1 Tax=Bifidobacterium saguinibicoloris TaxID=2834433 RepID=UPI003B838832